MDFQIIDSHLHSGIQNVSWGWEHVHPLLAAAGIRGAGVIPPAEDVYDRFNRRFTDAPFWQSCRRRAHRYLVNLKYGCPGSPVMEPHGDEDAARACQFCQIKIYPYFFVWNDFAWEELNSHFVAIKWHRHPDEPEYQYHHPRCREFLQVVRTRKLPILFEESLENTVFFLDHLASDLPVVIPHLGSLNGGYTSLKDAGVWDRPLVYADTSTAALAKIEDFLGRYGSHRLMFASDFPFGNPQTELGKIQGLNLPEDQARAVLGDNFRRIYGLAQDFTA